MAINQLIKNEDNVGLGKLLSTLNGFEIGQAIATRALKDQLLVFSLLEPKHAAETFDYLSLHSQKELLHALPSSQIAAMLHAMHPDDRTALLEELPKATVDEYLTLLPEAERTLSLKLLGYPEDRVGHIMTTDYLAVKMDWSVERVLDHIRAYGHDSETINVIYVIDDSGKLIDDVKVREFLFVPKNKFVSQVSDGKFISLNANDKAESAINIFKEYDRVALPVIDDRGVLLGIVTIDDILRLAAEESTEDMQKVGGMEALDEPYMETPFFELMKKRARWLVILFIGEMFTATAMGYFEYEIAQAVVLALFLPLIISSGGNSGSQSSTLIIRALALGEIKLKDWFRIMKREINSGIFLGCILGFIGFARVSLWHLASDIYGPHWLLIAITIFLSLFGVVLWGTLSGAMLPLILRRCGIDPATSSAPLVATLVDVTGITIYFGIALYVLQGTLL